MKRSGIDVPLPRLVGDLIRRRCPFCGAPRTIAKLLRVRRGLFKYWVVECGFCWARGTPDFNKAAAVWDWNAVGNKKAWEGEQDPRRDNFIKMFANAEAHGRRSRTVKPLVGSLDGAS